MKNRVVKPFVTIAMAFAVLLGTAPTYAQESNATRALNIDRILNATRTAASRERTANTARENQFKAERSKQQGRLNAMRNERVRQERIGDDLDRQFKENEVKIEELQTELARELGDLKQLFGVIQLSASEAQESYKSSLISAQYPDRAESLRQMVAKMASLTDLVSIQEIEDLWFQLQNEMTEQGKIVQYTAPVKHIVGYEEDEQGNRLKNEEGRDIPIYEEREMQVTRVGVFNAVAGDDILQYSDGLGFVALERKMPGDFNTYSQNLQNANAGVTPFKLDPTKGALLAALVQAPTLGEKVNEGGIIGYIIIALGILALLIAALRILVLMGVEGRVRKQARNLKKPSLGNPLGRVLKVYQDNPDTDPETMELKLGEAMLKESPKLNAWIMFVKIIAVVAPLLGLLGTVTGMIQTFQAITLYGAGDPQTMAGGISQALVTTVLGLVVAIPTVFAHWLASTRAKRVEDMLEEHAAGLIAAQYEGQR
ncbi:flagellar motor protein MotA [Arenicella chitinivorans]|uniref:Flagellar motor protein MotA n=1 Tax=Arenicella chitinivorans TaxID=1329800 RepID=A0A918VPK2_9GAMM|nr:MotA/TolQ/ExbB proton channel family protein [Arenicella chitinivorans]GHA12371.1 flagellar motor protein MotA [Arenicella chitinivorans]